MKRRTIAVAILVLAVLGLFAMMRIRAPKPPPPSTQEIWTEAGVPVQVGRAIRGNMEQLVQITGDVEALQKSALSAKVAGRVAAVYAREGDTVSQGQTIVLLDQEDALSGVQEAEAALSAANARLSQARTNATVTRTQTDSAIEQAQAGLDAAQAQLAVAKKPARTQERLVAQNRVASARANMENAEATRRRQQMLLNEGAISQASFDIADTQYKIARADYNSAVEQLSLIEEGGRSEDIQAAQSQVDVARQQLRQARANASQNLLRQEDIKSAEAGLQQARAAVSLARQRLSYTYIKSPISGRLASRTTEPAQVVAPGQPLAEVVSLGSLYLRGEVSETELPSVKAGQPAQVRIDALAGQVFTGSVDKIYPTGSTSSRNFPVRIRIGNPEGAVRPGMFGRGTIVTGVDRDVLLVPKDAVVERRGTRMVFTIGEDNKAQRHDVEVVRESRDHLQIRQPSDLAPGDRVVVAGQQNLQDGTRILLKRPREATSRGGRLES